WGVVLVALTEVFAWGPWVARAASISSTSVLITAILAALLPRHRALAGLGGFIAAFAVGCVWFLDGHRARLWWREPAVAVEAISDHIYQSTAPIAVAGVFTDLMLASVLLLATGTSLALLRFAHPLVAGSLTALLLLITPAVTGISTEWPI